MLAFAGDPGTAAEPPGVSAASGAVVAELARYAVADMPAQPVAAAVEPPESDAAVPDVEALLTLFWRLFIPWNFNQLRRLLAHISLHLLQ